MTTRRTDRWTDRKKMDGRTDLGHSDPYVPICLAGDRKMCIPLITVTTSNCTLHTKSDNKIICCKFVEQTTRKKNLYRFKESEKTNLRFIICCLACGKLRLTLGETGDAGKPCLLWEGWRFFQGFCVTCIAWKWNTVKQFTLVYFSKDKWTHTYW